MTGVYERQILYLFLVLASLGIGVALFIAASAYGSLGVYARGQAWRVWAANACRVLGFVVAVIGGSFFGLRSGLTGMHSRGLKLPPRAVFGIWLLPPLILFFASFLVTPTSIRLAAVTWLTAFLSFGVWVGTCAYAGSKISAGDERRVLVLSAMYAIVGCLLVGSGSLLFMVLSDHGLLGQRFDTEPWGELVESQGSGLGAVLAFVIGPILVLYSPIFYLRYWWGAGIVRLPPRFAMLWRRLPVFVWLIMAILLVSAAISFWLKEIADAVWALELGLTLWIAYSLIAYAGRRTVGPLSRE
jgi:hypothetical protein